MSDIIFPASDIVFSISDAVFPVSAYIFQSNSLRENRKLGEKLHEGVYAQFPTTYSCLIYFNMALSLSLCSYSGVFEVFLP